MHWTFALLVIDCFLLVVVVTGVRGFSPSVKHSNNIIISCHSDEVSLLFSFLNVSRCCIVRAGM